MDKFIFILECIGTIAFAVSGALEAIRKKIDLLGVMVLGMVTAVGGGMIRDVVIGVTPPTAFRKPIYTLLALLTAILTFIFIYFKQKTRISLIGVFYRTTLLISDTLGLALFTVLGVQVAVKHGWESQLFLMIFVGVVTGVGGGIMRDLFLGSIPYVFQKHIYATASIGGAALCSLLVQQGVNMDFAMLGGAAVVIVVRFLAAYFRWNLPRVEEG